MIDKPVELQPLPELNCLRYGFDENRGVIMVMPSGFEGQYLVIIEEGDDPAEIKADRMDAEQLEINLGIVLEIKTEAEK